MAGFGLGQEVVPGGLDAVSRALERRRFGDSVSPLSQVGGATPTVNNPSMGLPPQTSIQGGGLPTPPSSGQTSSNTPPTSVPTPQDDEVKIILGALKNRLDTLSKLQQNQPNGAPNGGLVTGV